MAVVYEELHQRYGSHIARRVQVELNPTEFSQVSVDGLLPFLEARAEAAHLEYQTHVTNPFLSERSSGKSKMAPDVAYQRWREAEDLAYLIAIADDVSEHGSKTSQR